jgi:CheY-specific phosphatase CheX
MQPNKIHTALEAAVGDVLETMCFTSVLASSEKAIAAGEAEAAFTAELHFEGNATGGFRLAIPVKLARLVGSCFLGRDEAEISDCQAGEVVCELANMICGSVLSRMDSKAIFHITHPEVTVSEAAAGFDATACRRWFDLGDGVLITSVQLQPAV